MKSQSHAYIPALNYSRLTVTALDGDPGILALARKKAEAAGMNASFDEGMSFALPYADGEQKP